MPYTLAHPVVVLPLSKFRFLTMAGLVVGALSPDFEHVLRLKVVSHFSHTLLGLLWFCLPMGLMVVVMYRWLWAEPLRVLFPALVARKQVLVWADVPSVLIGALTHVVWDAFTHKAGWVVQHALVLQMPLGPLPAWNILQHASTLLGLITLLSLVLRSTRTFIFLAVVALGALVLTAFILKPLELKSLAVLSANTFIALSAVLLSLAGINMKQTGRLPKTPA
jgi:hypothetical protein